MQTSLGLLWLTACSQPFEEGKNPASFDSGETDSGGADTAGDTGEGATFVVSGVVTGPDGLPLAGVDFGGSTETTTDGAFAITGSAPLTVSFSRPGSVTATRVYTSAAGHARVGLLPEPLATPVSAAEGATITAADGSTLTIPAGALGTEGLVAVSFQPISLNEHGQHMLPPNATAADGRVALVYGAFLLSLEGAEGSVLPSTPLSLRLMLPAGAPTGGSSVLSGDGGAWADAASTATVDSNHVATLSVSSGGIFGVGSLEEAGCVTGRLLDAESQAAPGATVRSYLPTLGEGPASYLGETTSDADGNFCALAPASGATLLFDYTSSTGAVYMSATSVSGAGGVDTCVACNDLGNLALNLAGCATGNLYGPDAGTLPPSPFVWEEGDVAMSAADSTLTFYARGGETFHLVGPGGLTKTFTTSAGGTPETSTCTRLGNLQATEQCVQVEVSSTTGAVVGARVSGNGAEAYTGADGQGCLSAAAGSFDLLAESVVGAQIATTSTSIDLEEQAGTCHSGTCSLGATLTLPRVGCATGVVHDPDGNPLPGVTVWSSMFASAVSDEDGAYAVATAGAGTAAVWAAGYPLTQFDDSGPDGLCASVDFWTDPGSPPALVVSDSDGLRLIEEDGSETDLVTDPVIAVSDVHVSLDADLLLGLLNVYAWYGPADAADWGFFGSGSLLWSSLRIAPDASVVALQGYGASNPAIWLYEPDGTSLRQLSTTAGTDVDGLAFSHDSTWLASTRKDGGIEVTPTSGARGPTTIASSPCAHPVWFDTNSIALDCSGDVYLYEMDGSGSVSWLTSGDDERVWAVSSAGRVVFSAGAELRVANIDLSEEAVLYAGSTGTTFSRVRLSADGRWIAAVVSDPSSGVDVLAVADQPPYTPNWLTMSPAEIETSAAWYE